MHPSVALPIISDVTYAVLQSRSANGFLNSQEAAIVQAKILNF